MFPKDFLWGGATAALYCVGKFNLLEKQKRSYMIEYLTLK